MRQQVGGPTVRDRIAALVATDKEAILVGWVAQLLQNIQTVLDRPVLIDICSRLLDELQHRPPETELRDQPDLLQGMRDLLSGVSADFAERGLSPAQTATFVLSLKRQLHPHFADDPNTQLAMHELVDAMGIFSMDAFIARREHIIRRQTQELMEVSVPVVPLWEGILSLPIIGTLDSGRAQAITEKLLLELARTNSRHALIDISGVPTVDTQTAQYLAKTVAAARLMGAECVVTGIRPAIAQVMVALGINFNMVQTRFSLAEGLRYCFAQRGIVVKRQDV